MSKGTREVVLRVPEETAQHIERLEKKTLDEVLVMVWDRYLADGRRTTIETKNIPVSWPLDWYEKMQTTWGRGMIPHEVRKIIQAAIDDDKRRPLVRSWSGRTSRSTRRRVTRSHLPTDKATFSRFWFQWTGICGYSRRSGTDGSRPGSSILYGSTSAKMV